jgi:hypothetical protein
MRVKFEDKQKSICAFGYSFRQITEILRPNILKSVDKKWLQQGVRID